MGPTPTSVGMSGELAGDGDCQKSRRGDPYGGRRRMGAPAGHRAARVACPPPGVGVTPAGSGPLAGLVLRKGNSGYLPKSVFRQITRKTAEFRGPVALSCEMRTRLTSEKRNAVAECKRRKETRDAAVSIGTTAPLPTQRPGDSTPVVFLNSTAITVLMDDQVEQFIHQIHGINAFL